MYQIVSEKIIDSSPNINTGEFCRSKMESLRNEISREYPNDFVKIIEDYEDDDINTVNWDTFNRETRAAEILQSSDLAPKLKAAKQLETIKIYYNNKWISTCRYSCIVLEKYGVNLCQKYNVEEVKGPGGYIQKGSLAIEGFHHLFKDIPLPTRQKVLRVLYTLAQKYKIYHEDIKPANFLIDDNNNIRVIDFGCSSIV